MSHDAQVKKPLFTVGIVMLLMLAGLSFLPASRLKAQTGADVSGVFEGITACSGVDRPMPQIPIGAECEMMIWEVTFYQNPDTAAPTTYQLHVAYGMSQPNTTGMRGGGTPIDLEGEWRITEGIVVDNSATVYELNPDTPESALYFVKLNDNMLHVLSPDKALMLGNAAWSYTLNRTDTRVEAPAVSLPSAPVDTASTQGVFEGRTPCADVIVEFTEYPVSPDCIKIKMRITLYRDPATGVPTTYHLKSTGSDREGTWTETLGTPAQPNALIYQLSLDTPDHVISFLRTDDNHLFALDENMELLVGDDLWSFTLSRDPKKSAEMEG